VVLTAEGRQSWEPGTWKPEWPAGAERKKDQQKEEGVLSKSLAQLEPEAEEVEQTEPGVLRHQNAVA
jgi:hypothetical protein